jgi:peptidoglycan/xylan/chitin deacetylase (PgdA/CDA1 family)
MIVEMHGVVDNFHTGNAQHRRLFDSAGFRALVEEARRSLALSVVCAEDALLGKGVHFTVDDSTLAGMVGASILADAGFPVTWFINPSNVISGVAYPFAEVNTFLSAAPPHVLGSLAKRLACPEGWTTESLRIAIKMELLKRRSEESMREYLYGMVGEDWVLGTVHDQSILAPPTVRQLEEVVAKGARLGNHGWSHINFAVLDPDQRVAQRNSGAAWLERRFGQKQGMFAVPYGKALPTENDCQERGGVWLLADKEAPRGWIGSGIYNRVSADCLEELECVLSAAERLCAACQSRSDVV